MARLSVDDKKWRAEQDMDTLTRAEEIRADRKRLSAARKAGKDSIKKVEKALKGKK